MKSRPTQFGARENTASPRQHAPRFAENARSNAICIEEENSEVAEDSLLAEPLAEGNKSRLHATSQHAATKGEGRARAERSAQASTLKPSQESKPTFETLIGSPDAAKLLGNIHVKTLQRYARTGSLPGYQIGGHWYFRVSELDAWLQSRINSNCQPADRVDFTQEKTQ
jgi:excisionase family DNA binding protein